MKLRAVAALGLTAALALTACGGDATEEATNAETTAAAEETSAAADESSAAAEETAAGSDLSGELAGMGSSAMRVAQDAWTAAFMAENPGVTVSYAAEGSGAGREGIQNGSVQFAGSDRAFRVDENQAGAFASCAADSHVLNLPVYISPIAVIFNLEGVESLNMDAATVAGVFKGDIAKWNDPAIAALNEGVELPDEFITIVHRADDSGTTENFTDYLSQAAPEVWDAEADGMWPYEGGQPAPQTDGVKNAVASGQGTIGYVDASAADGVGIVSIGSEGNFFAPEPEAAAAAVEASPMVEGTPENDLALELDRQSTEGYPISLVAYAIACQNYEDQATADLVKGYLTFISSEAGQSLAAEQAGSAALSAGLRDQVAASIESINA
ncbi:phosphate ABC transporter substrate-binding protein PstS [Tessaracoccus oleiagri]|uniref:Phosphate-binding protein n=1 Tax=Tessaracoccus oleiagri TaxID=686624 RepID=A0A1G9MVP9_9ACTN|nr:phosphate ABC transporter substrate-binding protein PstS [Tessaracoccus oleiagri]SDL78101.1 phosphate ABC transporter substrate-binding protein, PhoT family (TC 3.A.1.7.1) [Tessaracoccus oleiagri]